MPVSCGSGACGRELPTGGGKTLAKNAAVLNLAGTRSGVKGNGEPGMDFSGAALVLGGIGERNKYTKVNKMKT